jgi:hypothetical protein
MTKSTGIGGWHRRCSRSVWPALQFTATAHGLWSCSPLLHHTKLVAPSRAVARHPSSPIFSSVVEHKRSSHPSTRDAWSPRSNSFDSEHLRLSSTFPKQCPFLSLSVLNCSWASEPQPWPHMVLDSRYSPTYPPSPTLGTPHPPISPCTLGFRNASQELDFSEALVSAMVSTAALMSMAVIVNWLDWTSNQWQVNRMVENNNGATF